MCDPSCCVVRYSFGLALGSSFFTSAHFLVRNSLTMRTTSGPSTFDELSSAASRRIRTAGFNRLAILGSLCEHCPGRPVRPILRPWRCQSRARFHGRW